MTSHIWLSMFASRLIEQRPSASLLSSVRRAVSNFQDARNLDPRGAADRYAAPLAKAKQASVKQETASSGYQGRARSDTNARVPATHR